MSEHGTGGTVRELLRQDLQHTKADLHRSREALHRDLEQTKADLTRGHTGEELNQRASDTIRQLLGSEPIPDDGGPNPELTVAPVDPSFRVPRCSDCRGTLVHEQDCWVCPSGHGYTAIYPVASRRVGPLAVQAVRAAARASSVAGGRPCPVCESPMVEVDLEWEETLPSALLRDGEPRIGCAHVETCTSDGLIWFDRASAAAIPRAGEDQMA